MEMEALTDPWVVLVPLGTFLMHPADQRQWLSILTVCSGGLCTISGEQYFVNNN